MRSVVPMLSGPIVPDHDPVNVTPVEAPVTTGVKLALNEPFPTQAMEGAMEAGNLFVTLVKAAEATVIVRPIEVVPSGILVELLTAPEKAESVPWEYMLVPANDAAVIWFVPVVNPDAEIRTEVPAGPVEGVRVTVGAMIVN